MKECCIYLAGAMSGLSFEEQTKWRQKVKDAILYGGYDYDFSPVFIDPTRYYNFEEISHKSEKEVMNFDLNKVRTSDLIVVNFNDPSSLGTMAELAVAYEHRIPIIGMNNSGKILHPWQIEFCNRICDDMYELVSHIVEFYLK